MHEYRDFSCEGEELQVKKRENNEKKYNIKLYKAVALK